LGGSCSPSLSSSPSLGSPNQANPRGKHSPRSFFRSWGPSSGYLYSLSPWDPPLTMHLVTTSKSVNHRTKAQQKRNPPRKNQPTKNQRRKSPRMTNQKRTQVTLAMAAGATPPTWVQPSPVATGK